MLFVRRLTVAAMACTLAASPGFAWGQSTAAEFKKAQETFVGRLKSAASGQAPYPRLNDRDGGPTMRAALDSRSLALIDFSDLGAGFAVCGAGAEAVQAYVTIGLPRSVVGNPTPEQAVQIEKNAVAYRDEFSLATAFTIDCFGRMMGPLTTFWNSLDKPTQDQRKQGVVLVRNGTTSIYEGGIEMIAQSTYSPENKELILATLVRNAETFVVIMTPVNRARLVSTIDRAEKLAPAAMRPRLKQLRAVFSRTACTGLCAI